MFVELAMNSAGETAMDVDRVTCFHRAVTGYASFIFDLKRDAGYKELLEVSKKVWEALEKDKDLSTELVRFRFLPVFVVFVFFFFFFGGGLVSVKKVDQGEIVSRLVHSRRIFSLHWLFFSFLGVIFLFCEFACVVSVYENMFVGRGLTKI